LTARAGRDILRDGPASNGRRHVEALSRMRQLFAVLIAVGLSLSSPRPAVADPARSPSPTDAIHVAVPDTAFAAEADHGAQVPTPEHTGIHAFIRNLGYDFKNLPSKPNFIIAGIGGGLALAVHPADDTVNQKLQGTHGFFAAGSVLGNTATQMGISLAIYATGRLSHSKKASHLGMDLLRAQIITEAMTETLKLAVHRERPDGSNNRSFPSGHASVTFATATVIYRHLGYKWAVPTYLFASYVAMSRLHDNRHYLSDVVFGAAVGVIGGRTVTRHGRNNYTWSPVAMPGGMAILVTRMPHGG
jgi:membrane-associated phospholipid phosphatase